MRNTNSLMENMKLYKGSHPFVDLAGDLAYKKDYSVNSWFYTSRFQVEGQDISTLVHLISLNVPGLTPEPVMLCMAAATNETTGEYYGGSDEALPFSLLQVSDDKYDIRTPKIAMYGDLDEMHVKAEIYGGAGAIDFTMKAVGWPIFNSGNAHFPIGLMNVYQYSLPTLSTTGTLTLGDKTYEVEGTSWYDRQWQNTPGIMDAKWAWMNMDMDNGDFISIWDIDFIGGQRRNSFATILKPNGTQMVVPAEPFGCADVWQSEVSGRSYPTRFTVKIPATDTCLDVVATPRKQEICSMVDPKYEGAAAISGVHCGKTATGHCVIELVGEAWKGLPTLPNE